MKFINVNLLLSATAVVTTAPLIIAQVSSHPIQFVCYFHLLWFWYMKSVYSNIIISSLSSAPSLYFQPPQMTGSLSRTVGPQLCLRGRRSCYFFWPSQRYKQHLRVQFMANHLCGQAGFQPGKNTIGPGTPQNDPEPAWKMAWTLVGGCSRTPVSMINRSSNASMFVTMIITSNQSLNSPLHPFNFD